MKKLSLILLFLLIFPFLFKNPSFAYESTSEQAVLASLDYELPYPGLLPDSPLYFLKPLRDQVVNFLISDSLKKAEFKLLLADKRLSGGVALFAKRKDKTSLVISTISKGENYLDEAITFAKRAKKEGRDISDISQKLLLSTEKHKSVLLEMEKKAGKNNRDFPQVITRINEIKKRVNELIGK